MSLGFLKTFVARAFSIYSAPLTMVFVFFPFQIILLNFDVPNCRGPFCLGYISNVHANVDEYFYTLSELSLDFLLAR